MSPRHGPEDETTRVNRFDLLGFVGGTEEVGDGDGRRLAVVRRRDRRDTGTGTGEGGVGVCGQ